MIADALTALANSVEGARFLPGPGDLGQLHLTNAGGSAVISPYGAQVLSFRPAGQEELLFVSGQSLFSPGKAIRGGIPVCWPYFGKHPSDGTKPSHGTARISFWDVEDLTFDGERHHLKLHLSSPSDDLELSMDLSVGRTLQIRLTTENAGNAVRHLTQALHSYFRVGDVRQVRVEGLEDRPYFDAVTGKDCIQQGPVRIDREVDRVYQKTPDRCVIHDPVLKRQIAVSKTGSLSTVVWNPWIDKARTLKDFGDGEYPSMLCVESTNARSDGRDLQPGQSHTLTLEIAVS